MASVYSSFLQAPNPSHLASDATINYITTTTSITEPNAIIKHLAAQQKLCTKKEERILNAVEGAGSLFLETETTIQFNNGGGAYLPSMDENLLDEKMVTFPLLHVVQFDADRKIKQIRLYWDQGTLLKQVEAIGKTGRNWPIRDGGAQIEAITRSVNASGGDSHGTLKSLGSRGPGPNDVVIRQHKKQDSISATRDPHASLNLFAARDPNADAQPDYDGPAHAPRASAKPAPRNYNELFANGESPAAAPGSKVRDPSPSKVEGHVLKAGAGKHNITNRIFDDNEPSGMGRSPERKKVFNQKYDHFAFGDGEDAPQGRATSPGKAKGGASTFSFDDFNTPPKYQGKARRDDQVHWGGAEDPPSPLKRPIVHAARKDADSHFQMTDDASPAVARKESSGPGMKLYDDPVYDQGNTSATKQSRSNTTSTDAGRRGDDFGTQHKMSNSPGQKENAPPGSKRAVRGSMEQSGDMEQHWGFSESKAEHKIYKTAGDGMGGRAGARDWMIGEDEKKIYKTAGDGMGGRKANTARGWVDEGDGLRLKRERASEESLGRGKGSPGKVAKVGGMDNKSV